MIGTYSIDVEYCAYYFTGGGMFFLGGVMACVVCVCRVFSEAMLLTPDTHSMECPFKAF